MGAPSVPTIEFGVAQFELSDNRSTHFLRLRAFTENGSAGRVRLYPKYLTAPNGNVVGETSLEKAQYLLSFDFLQRYQPESFSVKITTLGSIPRTYSYDILTGDSQRENWQHFSLPFESEEVMQVRILIELNSGTTPGRGLAEIGIDALTLNKIGSSTTLFKSNLSFDKDFILEPPSSDVLVSVISGNRSFARVEKDLTKQTQPQWFTEAASHVHTRISNPKFTNDGSGVFWNFRDHLTTLGAKVHTRFFKPSHTGTWWPTAIPNTDAAWQADFIGSLPPADKNVAGRIIDNSHEKNKKVIAYLFKESDPQLSSIRTDLLALEPDDLTADEWPFDGSSDEAPAGPYKYLQPTSAIQSTQFSISGDYLDIYASRVEEVVSMGADGVYFDFIHGPQDGDWSDPDLFNALFAGGLPLSKNLEDSQYRKLLSLYNETNIDFYREIQQRLARINEELATPISLSRFTRLFDNRWSTSFIEQIQTPKTEWSRTFHDWRTFFSIAVPLDIEDRVSNRAFADFSLFTLRDAAYGRRPHSWIHNPGLFDRSRLGGQYDDYTSAAILNGAVSTIHATGLIANVDVSEHNLPVEPFKTAITTGNRLGELLTNSTGYSWIRFHFPEDARDKIVDEAASTELGYEQFWEEVFGPLLFSFEHIYFSGLPVGVISDNQLRRGHFGDAKIVVLANSSIPEIVERRLDTFMENGGRVIFLDSLGSNWTNKSSRLNLLQSLDDEIGSHADARSIVTMRSDTEFSHGHFKANHLGEEIDTIVIAKDSTWAASDCYGLSSAVYADCVAAKVAFKPTPTPARFSFRRKEASKFELKVLKDGEWQENVAVQQSGAHIIVELEDVSFMAAVSFIPKDSDRDGTADSIDNCITVANAGQENSDNDSFGNACDSDDDNDSLSDAQDNCPLVSNLNQSNFDDDTLGDACDADDDNDFINDLDELADGTNPFDSGSFIEKKSQRACAETNSFFDGRFWNIAEHLNPSETTKTYQSELRDMTGLVTSQTQFSVNGSSQYDLLAHDMPGWGVNRYGVLCTELASNDSVVQGNMSYYLPSLQADKAFDFIFSFPLSPGKHNNLVLSLNTNQASFDQNADNRLVANWVQLSNISDFRIAG